MTSSYTINGPGGHITVTPPPCPPPEPEEPDQCEADSHNHAYSPGWCHSDDHLTAPECHATEHGSYRIHREDSTHEYRYVEPCAPTDPDPDPAVGVFGLADATGTGVITASFTVEPASTTCTAERILGPSATVWVSGASRVGRAVSVDATTSGAGTEWDVRVVCSARDHTDTTVIVTFTVEGPQTDCETHLGTLGSQTVTRQGTWSATDSCRTPLRGDAQTPYYARRYTFTLDTAATVDATVDSHQATYVYLLPYPYSGDTEPHARGATRASQPLAAGGHAIVVVRDTPRRADGAFTLTVDTDIEEPEPVTVTGLADSHRATVGELFSVGFAYEPAAAVLSVESVTPSGLTFALVDLGGAAGLAGTPSLAGVYTVNLAFTQPGRVDIHSFTVTAQCPEGHTELPDRSCGGLAAVCTESLSPGWVSSGTLGPQTGSWDSGCVLPEGRMGRSGTFYAEHYMFTLLFDAVVTIDLTSSTDTYLFLLERYGAHGTEVDRDNDSGAGSNSKLANVSLAAGGYTVVASTYQRERTGEFEVSLEAYVPLTVTELADSHSATVGELFSTRFSYRPSAAEFSVRPVTPAGLTLTPVDVPGRFVLLFGTPERAETYEVTLAFTQGSRTDTRTIEITATCPARQLSLSGTCAEPLRKLKRRHYVSIGPPPAGHLTNSCYKTDLSDGSRVYTCRRIRESRTFISKASDQIVAASEPHATFGTMLTVRSDEILEGCQSITSDYWQCDFRADLIWTERTGAAEARYIYPAFISGVVEPLKCAAAMGVFWFNVRSVTPNAATFTTAVVQCEALLVEEDE